MPGAGPILLFDKSVLQSLTVDEAVWLDTFYFPLRNAAVLQGDFSRFGKGSTERPKP